MTGQYALETLLAGLSDAKRGELTLRKGQLEDWPQGVINALLSQRVLIPTKPAQSIDCDGCEMNCSMPVHVFAAEDGRPARAFISCDKPINVGRVPVRLEQLTQWKMTGISFASALCRALEISTAPKLIGKGPGFLWNLGMIRGTKYRAEIKISLGQNPYFEIGGHQKPVNSLLALNEKGLELDRAEINWMLDHPLKGNESTGLKATNAKRELRKIATQKTYSDWRRLAKAFLSRHPNASIREVAQYISRQPGGKGKSPDTIRRHLEKVG